MPPTLYRSSWSSLSKCTSNPAIVSRGFSTSSSRAKIGPESPKFIEIPKLVQPAARRTHEIKGVLPTPRNLFPNRAGDKTSIDYLAATTPEPISEAQLRDPATPYVAWKRRMAATRRQNLREGLVDLHQRKQRTDRFVARTSQQKQEDRERRVNAPIREDERLTNSTVTAAMRQLTIGNVPDPNREARLALGAERVAAKAQAKEERRQDALHTLYMHARDFITTEAQLNAEIEKVFVERPFDRDTNNIWDAKGAPHTVQDMISQISGTQKDAMSFHSGPAKKTAERMRKIAEELTGGKMDRRQRSQV